jgi:hypothetical protein
MTPILEQVRKGCPLFLARLCAVRAFTRGPLAIRGASHNAMAVNSRPLEGSLHTLYLWSRRIHREGDNGVDNMSRIDWLGCRNDASDASLA